MGNNYYQVDYANEVTKLNAEKQELISWLEDKIINEKRKAPTINSFEYGEKFGRIWAYQEVLDFVNKGGKDERKISN